MKLCCRLLWLSLLGLVSLSTFGDTWYVRPHGGTRYSVNDRKGQCDGKADADYHGSGSNQHCAFSDIRSLWTDGSYCVDDSSKSTCWKWVGKGGDTYLIRGSIGTGVTYRIGPNGPNSKDFLGLAGNPMDRVFRRRLREQRAPTPKFSGRTMRIVLRSQRGHNCMEATASVPC